ncbi:MAG: 2Fe-2S iron-sulfur cluster-binding protein [Proteobacteria bacterium]|nr:2Fe-2S iron-sulfur cluster-binding protein [Pseudomonadota bacterium]
MPRVTFVLTDGTRQEIEAAAGATLLQIAWDNRIDIEGACGGVMACSTCHVIVDPAHIGRLQLPDQEEDEMLDLAWGLTPTSRLGCQIVLTEALDGLVVSLPAETHNLLGG